MSPRRDKFLPVTLSCQAAILSNLALSSSLLAHWRRFPAWPWPSPTNIITNNVPPIAVGISSAYLGHILVKSWAYLGHISGISQAYIRHNSGICQAYIRHILAYLGHILGISWAIYGQDIPKICPRYARDMPKICPQYALDMPIAYDSPKICTRYNQDMPKICPRYNQDVTTRKMVLTKRLSRS